jgi:hypothetical protein
MLGVLLCGVGQHIMKSISLRRLASFLFRLLSLLILEFCQYLHAFETWLYSPFQNSIIHRTSDAWSLRTNYTFSCIIWEYFCTNTPFLTIVNISSQSSPLKMKLVSYIDTLCATSTSWANPAFQTAEIDEYEVVGVDNLPEVTILEFDIHFVIR